MKEFAKYSIFSLVSLVLSIIFSLVFDFSLSNSWQAGIVLPFVFGPYWLYGWKKSAKLKEKMILFFLARFYLILILLVYFIVFILFLTIGW